MHLAVCEDPVDLVWLVDGSGSVMDKSASDRSWNSWNEALYFVNNVTSRLQKDNTNVAFIQYSNTQTVNIKFMLTPAKDVMNQNRIGPDRIWFVGGSTDTAAAMTKARTDVIQGINNRNWVKDVVVILTDGRPSAGETLPSRLEIFARDLQDSGRPRPLKIIVVGVSEGLRTYEDLRIASSYRDILYVDQYVHLRSRVDDLVRMICPGNVVIKYLEKEPYWGKMLIEPTRSLVDQHWVD